MPQVCVEIISCVKCSVDKYHAWPVMGGGFLVFCHECQQYLPPDVCPLCHQGINHLGRHDHGVLPVKQVIKQPKKP